MTLSHLPCNLWSQYNTVLKILDSNSGLETEKNAETWNHLRMNLRFNKYNILRILKETIVFFPKYLKSWRSGED